MPKYQSSFTLLVWIDTKYVQKACVMYSEDAFHVDLMQVNFFLSLAGFLYRHERSQWREDKHRLVTNQAILVAVTTYIYSYIIFI